MWRWWVSVLLTAAAVSVHVIISPPSGPHGGGGPVMLAIGWLTLLVLASPTILIYRFLILLGERLTPKIPLLGAAGLVVVGASAPPVVHNSIAASREVHRNFVRAVPENLESVAIEEISSSPELLQRGVGTCGDECLRLLFASAARQVIVGDPEAEAPTARRGIRESTEPVFYATAHALRIERRSICPPVLTYRDQPHQVTVPGGPLIAGRGSSRTRPTLEDRAIGLMASGYCLVSQPAIFSQSGLRLGSRMFGGGRGIAPLPDTTGLIGAQYRFVDARRESGGWTRLAQRMEVAHAVRWIFPFAVVPNRHSWFASRLNSSAVTGRTGWDWAGIRLQEPAYIGAERTEALLEAAVDLPASAPRDARHMLAFSYLRGLAERPARPGDLDLLARIIADRRVAAGDLAPLREVARRGNGSAIGAMLARRMADARPGGREIGLLAQLVSAMPRESWPAILPDVRRLAADPERAGEARSAFALFAAGDARDAAFLLTLFRRNWPPISMARVRHPAPETLRREQLTRDARIMAYLDGLCALPARREAVMARLVEASMQIPLPGQFDGLVAGQALWRTLAAMGAPVQQVAERRRPNDEQRREIERIAQSPGRSCLPNHRRQKVDGPARGAVPVAGG